VSTAEQVTVGALDIGGTHVTAARVALPAAAVEPGSRRRLPLRPDGERGELLATITRAASAVRHQGMGGWGVAVPGPFDYQGGVCLIRGVGKLEALYGVDLRRELAGALQVDDLAAVRFLNDADAFLLGEWWAGAAKGHRRCVGVTIGTGLGSAFLEDGRIIDADSRVPPHGRLDLIRFRGRPIEETVSRRGLLAHYGVGEPGVDVEQLAERARVGEPEAVATFRDTFGALGEFLVPWLDRFGASCLVVGGAIARSFDLIAPPLLAALGSLPRLKDVTGTALGEDAALLGAALHMAAPYDSARGTDQRHRGERR
jgi:predicted NBD/HSP70 family sugar kinase